ncbi:MAG: acid phosphatase [Calditrichae bacterium]|nr:acid phosphatase [Calditrichota bacterium]MCB9059474.1 acid phosphatase [Calditrichia bacterium]
MKAFLKFSLIFMLGSCASSMNDNLNSTLWMQTAAEYQASTMQTYNTALANVSRALNDKSWTAALEQTGEVSELPPAIILDVDETVLDNSAYEAKMIKEHGTFTPQSWDNWVHLQKAGAVPGAVDFINKVQEMGVTAILLTNRACEKRQNSNAPCPQEDDTIENLKKAGIKNVSAETVLLKNEKDDWTSEKKSRRTFLAQKYRIIMLFGDDLGDFLADVKKNITPQQRAALVEQYAQNWGTKWFVLPNPTYGSWYNVLQAPREQYLQDY